MIISIKNCNNIDSADVELEPSCLNIKYGLNGTGKTTIARAIEAFVNNDEDTKQLLRPFKYANAPAVHEPEVAGLDNIKSVKTFNEAYVERFVFTQESLFPNAFNVFVKTPEYDKRMQNISSHLQKIKMLFESNVCIKDLLRCFAGFAEGFGKSAKGFSKSSPIAKGIAKGNLVEHIPQGLQCFAAYIRCEMQNNWIKWHADGKDYFVLQDHICPYCAQDIEDAEVRERIRLVEEKYDSNAVKHLVNVVRVFKELATEGLSADSAKFVNEVTARPDGFSADDANRLLAIKSQVDALARKLQALQSINFYSEKDDPARIKSKLAGLHIDLLEFADLKSDKVSSVVDEVNAAIDSALASVDVLQKEIAEQQEMIVNTIDKYDTHINAFLELAGYPYRVKIDDLGNEKYQTRLWHVDLPGTEVLQAKEHLSYGERNAFALALFLYDAISSKADLVILDDPISSFDGNKKFALLKMMFWDEDWNTLSGKTVLMLTHDFCPVIDVKRTFAKEFPGMPRAWYLKCVNGEIKEKEIGKKSVQSALEINRRNVVKPDKDVLLRIVYYRKWRELKGCLGDNEYNLVSNVEHLRSVPMYKNANVLMNMSADAVKEATDNIKSKIKGFDYVAVVKHASDKKALRKLYNTVQCNFEKILIFRYIVKAYELWHGTEPALDGIIRKYMNEPFHVENDYVYQLDPYEFDPVSDSQIHLFDAKVDELLA